MKLAEKIIAYRKGKNLTQQQLADLLFVSAKTVSKWETGRGNPEISILPKLASVLGTTVDDLLSDREPLEETSVPLEDNPQPEPLPSTDIPLENDVYETRFALSRSKSKILWIFMVFVPMVLYLILSLFAMGTGYENAVATGLSVLLGNTLFCGLIALSLYLSYKDSRGFAIYGLLKIIFTMIGIVYAFSNGLNNSLGILAPLFQLLMFPLDLAIYILIILFSFRKVTRHKTIVILLWVSFGLTTVYDIFSFRTDFAINALNDLIMMLVSISTVLGVTRIFPMFGMRKVKTTKKNEFFKDPV